MRTIYTLAMVLAACLIAFALFYPSIHELRERERSVARGLADLANKSAEVEIKHADAELDRESAARERGDAARERAEAEVARRARADRRKPRLLAAREGHDGS